MAETGSQILSYQGNAGLGAGASSIPVINPDANLNIINDAAKNIQYLNHDNNIKLYDQKIKDRDTTLALLHAGQISAGDINEADRPYYETARQNVQKAFDDMINKGGINNQDAYKNYLDKVTDLNNITTNAQSRNIELKKLQQERSQQALPEDKAAYDNHIKAQQQKSFWQPIDPFQKAFNYDINSSTAKVTGQPTTLGLIGTDAAAGQPAGQTTWQSKTMKNGVETDKTTTKNAPARTGVVNNKTAKQPITIAGTQANPDGTLTPFSYTPEQYYDLPTIQKNVDELAATDPTERYTYQSFLNDFTNDQKLPPEQQLSTLKAYNNRIADYSTQRGIQPIGQNPDGTPKYPDQIKYYQDPVSGKVLIQETPASFFAKHALASINGDYVQKPQAIFNDKIGKYNIDLKKATSDEFYKHAMGNAALRKAGAYSDFMSQKIKTLKTAAEQDNFLNDLYTRNISNQPLLEGRGNNTATFSSVKASNSLPIFTLEGDKPKQLIPIDGVPVYANDDYKLDANGDKTLKVGAKLLYYKGGYYHPEYLLNGKKIAPAQITQNYNKFKQLLGDKWQGGLEDYLKLQIQKNNIDVTMQGANGTTDKDLNIAAQRIISNKNTKKGQTSVFDQGNDQPPLDESGVQEESNSDNNNNQ